MEAGERAGIPVVSEHAARGAAGTPPQPKRPTRQSPSSRVSQLTAVYAGRAQRPGRGQCKSSERCHDHVWVIWDRER